MPWERLNKNYFMTRRKKKQLDLWDSGKLGRTQRRVPNQLRTQGWSGIHAVHNEVLPIRAGAVIKKEQAVVNLGRTYLSGKLWL